MNVIFELRNIFW